MRLSKSSTGIRAAQTELIIKKVSETDRIISLAGNPNVGKSTVFNELTGLRQHTGNWPGKTVTNAQGYCTYRNHGYVMVDLPGCYSLMAHSAEEEVARDFICFGGADATVVVCDASCLERNLNLLLQTMEITGNVILCVNLMDEAEKKHISLDLTALSQKLGIPVVGTSARSRRGLDKLLQAVHLSFQREPPPPLIIQYPEICEAAVELLLPVLIPLCGGRLNPRWLALRLIEGDETITRSAGEYLMCSLESAEIESALSQVRELFAKAEKTNEEIRDMIVSSIVKLAEGCARGIISTSQGAGYSRRDRMLDRIFTSRLTGFPIMLLLLFFIFWLTISGANYPSELLSAVFSWLGDKLRLFLEFIRCPAVLTNLLTDGVYRTLSWVVAVMLPPMAIFFPLFTLLEDLGYLPRVAFNLDRCFQKCSACGKQALTMCMGFGCNAAGIVGCRIIDSPRERLIAMITNNFVPCNGRFPTIVAVITMFFIGAASGPGQTVISALFLVLVIVLGVAATLLVSKLLSKTVLKGIPSSFKLELPPYRRPQVGKVIVRSIFDRTLFVLGRAAVVAAPAGLIIWLMANIHIGESSLLFRCSSFLDPFARLMGLDGVILFAFILGFPANEIVVPIIIMAYLSEGSLVDMGNLSTLKDLLTANGWTWITAVSMILFSLMHWPCSTTCMTIKKETQSLKWTLVSFAVPTASGILLCMLFANSARLFF